MSYKKKNLNLLIYFDKIQLGSIPRVIISSFVIMLSFYSLPFIAEFSNKKIFIKNEFQNNSKKVLAYTLNQEKNGVESNNGDLDERDLLVDIFSLNDLETDTVRLNASTIKQLFEDTDYKLDDVRKKKTS